MDRKKLTIVFSLIILTIAIFSLEIKPGRSIPNPNNTVELKDRETGEINLLYNYTDYSKNISLGKQNLITGAYAKRTMFVVEINKDIEDLNLLKFTKLYLDNNIIQNDNYFYKLGNKIYGIFVVDNEYSKDHILKMNVVNDELVKENIFEENMILSEKPANIISEGLIEINDFFSYKGSSYLRLPNKAADEIVILPLDKSDDLTNLLGDDDLTCIDIDTSKDLNNICKPNLFEYNMTEYDKELSSISIIKTSFYEDGDISKVGVKLKDSNIYIPLDDNIIRSN